MPRIAASLALAAVLSACADAPAGPSAEGLELLRAAGVSGDSLALAPLAAGGMLPVPGGVGLPMIFGPPTAGAPGMPPGRGDACRYDAATGRTSCAPTTFDGFTVTTSFAFADAAGGSQAAFGPTTDRVNSRSTMTGTNTFSPMRPGAPPHRVTLTVDRRSEHTISGLTDPSRRHRNDGTTQGVESSVIVTERGTVRIEQRFADTTTNLVLQAPPPRPAGGVAPGAPPPAFSAPLSGRMVRVAHTVETPPAGAPRTFEVRSVTEFLDGGVARTTVTVNGVTRVCTQWLLVRRPPECR